MGSTGRGKARVLYQWADVFVNYISVSWGEVTPLFLSFRQICLCFSFCMLCLCCFESAIVAFRMMLFCIFILIILNPVISLTSALSQLH